MCLVLCQHFVFQGHYFSLSLAVDFSCAIFHLVAFVFSHSLDSVFLDSRLLFLSFFFFLASLLLVTFVGTRRFGLFFFFLASASCFSYLGHKEDDKENVKHCNDTTENKDGLVAVGLL